MKHELHQTVALINNAYVEKATHVMLKLNTMSRSADSCKRAIRRGSRVCDCRVVKRARSERSGVKGPDIPQDEPSTLYLARRASDNFDGA